jgi:iron complex outermembrane receptor protein
MMAIRALTVLVCLLAICSPGADFALAQEQEEKPETEGSNEGTEEEEEETTESSLTETVKVTATRVETDLMKTPVAVTVLDQDTMDREGIRNVRDMAQMVPNMDIATMNGQSTPIISLRGVRSTNETELGDPSVGVHMDGIYSPRMQGMLGLMFDNERVEVARGPQGTLFGRNSTVGSINIISAKPKLDAFDSRVYLQYGNFNAPELQVMVNKPISETFAVRFAGRFHRRDSYLDGYWDPNQYDQRYLGNRASGAEVIAPGSFDDCTSPKCYTRTQHSNWWVDNTEDNILSLVPADNDDFYMNAKEWAYRTSALWQPKHKRMSLNFSFQHFRSDSAGGIDLVNCEKLRGRPTYLLDADNQLVLDDDGKPIVTGRNDCSTMFPKDDTYQAVVNVPGRLYLDIKYLRSQFTWDINKDLRFVFLAGGEDQDRESAQDMEQSLNAWDQAMFFLPGTGSRSWMGEAQLQSYSAKKFNWITGVNYFREKTGTIGFFDNPLDEKALWDQPNRSTNAWSLFGQGTYSFSNKWHLTLGYRHSDETKEDKGGVTYLCNNLNGCAPGLYNRDTLNSLPVDYFADSSIYPDISSNDNRGSWSHSDWRIGLDYQLENTLLYSYLATGFKAGGIGDVFEGTIVDGDIDEDGRPIIVSTENVVVRTQYDPEQVTTLELGFKQRLLDGKLNIKGAYFYSDYDDMQYASVGSLLFTERYLPVLDPNGNPVDADGDGRFDRAWLSQPLFVAYFTQNVPGAEIEGFEFEYDWRPWASGRIHGYVNWLDTSITEDWITKWDYDPVSYFGLSFAQSVDPRTPVLEVNLKGNDLAVSPPFKFHMTLEHSLVLPKRNLAIVPWVTAHWEDDSYLTIWNVDRHTDDMEFVILPQDIRYTDDKRNAWSMLHAGVRFYTGAWTMELYGYNLTDEVVQWWGGAAEQVAKGSFSTPRSYGFRIGYDF